MKTSINWGAIALRMLRAVFAGVLLLALFLLSAVFLLLESSSVSRILVAKGIAFYDEMIPAVIEFESIDGSIGQGLLLQGLEIYDGNGFKLVEVEEIELRLSYVELWRRSLSLETLRIHSPRIFLPHSGDGGFADLLPPDSSSTVPTANIGPNLPMRIEFDLESDAIEIQQTSEAKPTTVFRDGYLSVLGLAHGKHAKVQIVVDGEFPTLDLQVDELVTEIEWTEPLLNIQELRLQSSAGQVQLVQANLQAAKTRQNGQLSALLDRDWLGQFVPLAQLPEKIHLAIDLTLDQQFDNLVNVQEARQLVRSESYIDLGADGRLKLSIAGKIDPQYNVGFKIDGKIVPKRWLPRVAEKQSWYVDGHIQGSNSNLHAKLSFVCPSCEENRLELRGSLKWKKEQQQLRARVDIDYKDTNFEADIGLSEGQIRSATWKGSVGLLPWSRLSAWVIDPMSVDGKIETRGNCKKAGDRKGLDCAGTLNLSKFRWPEKDIQIDQVHSRIAYRGTLKNFFVDFDAKSSRGPTGQLTANVRLEQGLNQVALKTLKGKFWKHSLHLQKPTKISWSDEQLEVDRLKIRWNESYLDVHGQVAPKGQNHFEVRLTDFDLGNLRTWVPRVQIAGKLDFEMKLHGEWSTPVIGVRMGIQNLKWKSYQLGEALDLKLNYQNDLALADFRFHGRDELLVQGQASLPITIKPKQGLFEIRSDREMSGKLRFHRFDLEHLDFENLRTPAYEFLGFELQSLKPLRGVVAAKLDIQGSWSAPQARLELALKDLAWNQEKAGDLSLKIEYPKGKFEELSNNTNSRPKSTDETRYGVLNITINRNGHDWLYCRGAVPLAIDLTKNRFSWYRQKTHEFDLQVDPLELGQVSTLARLDNLKGNAFADVHFRGDTQAISGHAELRVNNAQFERGYVDRAMVYFNVDGRLDAPKFSTKVITKKLGWDGHDIANIYGRASYQDEQLAAKISVEPSIISEKELDSKRDRALSLKLQTNIPLAVDLRRTRFDLKPEKPHGIRLNFNNLDQKWLLAWSDMFLDNESPDHTSRENTFSNLEMMLSGKFDLAGTWNVFNMAGAIDGFIQHKETGRSNVSMRIQANQRAQRFDFRGGPQGPLELYAQLDGHANIPELLSSERKWENVQIKGNIEIKKLMIQALEDLVSTEVSNPEGNISAGLQAEGMLGSPRLRGQAKITDAQLIVVPLRQQFRNIDLDLRLDDRKIELRNFSAESGKKGRIELKGKMFAGKEVLDGQALLKLYELPFVRPGLPYTTINSEIRPRISVSEKVTQVKIGIDKTKVSVLGTNVSPPQAIPENANIRYASNSKVEKKCIDKSLARSSNKEVRVTINVQEPILVTGPQIELRWVGNLGVIEKDGETKVDGILQAKSGWVRFSGSKFDVVEGTITLPSVGDLDPYIRVLATTETPEAKVSILVQGRASEPELHLSSEPPMEEFQILSLLVTGSTEARDASDVNVQAEAAKLLAAFQNSALQQVLSQKLGIDRAELSFGETIDQPIVTTGKRITRDLYVESQYHHNAPADRNEAQVNVEYRFAPHWMIESFFGDAAAGGFDLYWFRRFGGPSNRPSTSEKTDRKGVEGVVQPDGKPVKNETKKADQQSDCDISPGGLVAD